MRGGRSHGHHQRGLDRSEFALIPLAASLDLRSTRFLVQTDFSARHEFEMLDRIGDIDLVTVDPGFFQRPVEHLSGGPYERLAGEVLLVAGLFSNEHDRCMGRSFAEHGLRRVLPQGAGAAVCGFRAQSRKSFGLDGRGTCHRWFLLPLPRRTRRWRLAVDHRLRDASSLCDQRLNQ